MKTPKNSKRKTISSEHSQHSNIQEKGNSYAEYRTVERNVKVARIEFKNGTSIEIGESPFLNYDEAEELPFETFASIMGETKDWIEANLPDREEHRVFCELCGSEIQKWQPRRILPPHEDKKYAHVYCFSERFRESLLDDKQNQE